MIPVLAAAIVLLLLVSLANQEGFDDVPDQPQVFFPDSYKQLAKAISIAEGYGIAGDIPTLANNPGDLILPNWKGSKLGGQGISVLDADTLESPLYPNGGWFKLLRQIQFIAEGHSHVYNLDMTIQDMAAEWTRTQVDDWATNVANALGVTPETTLQDLIG